jgi:hypothetical protein
VQNGRTCQILSLVLNELDLNLLGLNVHPDRVELTITGDRQGGILGRLFCSLANAGVKADRRVAVRALNSGLRRHPIRPMGFTVPAAISQAPGPTCQVLDLVLGPLHLELLGLIVDLNKVSDVRVTGPFWSRLATLSRA